MLTGDRHRASARNASAHPSVLYASTTLARSPLNCTLPSYIDLLPTACLLRGLHAGGLVADERAVEREGGGGGGGAREADEARAAAAAVLRVEGHVDRSGAVPVHGLGAQIKSNLLAQIRRLGRANAGLAGGFEAAAARCPG